MGVQLDDTYLRSVLGRAVTVDDAAEKRAAHDELISHLYKMEAFETWARGIANHYGRPDDWEDITHVITEKLLVYVREITPQTFASIDRVASHLYWKAKAAARQFLDSPAVTVASQMSGISRRYRQAQVARSAFIAQHGRVPTDRELVDYVNADMLARREDAAKQGALLSEADVSGQMLQAYSMDHQLDDGEGDGFGRPTEDDTVRTRGELAITVRRLAQIADREYPDVTEPTVSAVLAVWMDFVLENEPPTVSAIAAKLGLPRQQAKERMIQVDNVLALLREGEMSADD